MKTKRNKFVLSLRFEPEFHVRFVTIRIATRAFSAATDINKKVYEKKHRKREKRKTTYWFLTGIWSCGTPFAVYENTAGLIFCSKSIFIWVIFFPSFFSLLFFRVRFFFVSFSISFLYRALNVLLDSTLHKTEHKLSLNYLFRELMS